MNKEEDHINLIKSLVVDTLDWQQLTTFESRNSKKVLDNKTKYGSCGVYLITTKDHLTNEIINANIGYVGKSSNVFGRVYDVRGGEHGARKYINSKGINPEDVYVKILFTEEEGESLLERLIQEENFKQFGYKFSWKEASGGNDGAMVRILSDIEKIDNEADLKKIVDYIEEKVVNLYRANWRNR
jgi:hypothetical protein